MRMNRLLSLWNWLPAFRVVAQTEHLPTASSKLHVSPSALSRTIRLLEEEVGRPLFDRIGRRLVLNSDGRVLLRATRDAMRRVDDALRHLDGAPLEGPFVVAAPSAFVPVCVVPTLEAFMAEHPDFRPRVTSGGVRSATRQLLEGALDLLITDDPVSPQSDLQTERLVGISYGVYCGDGHPLAEAPRVTRKRVAEHPFVAPPDGGDHFPAGWTRTVAMEIGSLDLGVTLCATGRYLAVLPDLVARHHAAADQLHRLPLTLPQETALTAVYRAPVSDTPTPVSRVLTALREALSDI